MVKKSLKHVHRTLHGLHLGFLIFIGLFLLVIVVALIAAYVDGDNSTKNSSSEQLKLARLDATLQLPDSLDDLTIGYNSSEQYVGFSTESLEQKYIQLSDPDKTDEQKEQYDPRCTAFLSPLGTLYHPQSQSIPDEAMEISTDGRSYFYLAPEGPCSLYDDVTDLQYQQATTLQQALQDSLSTSN